MSYRPERTGRAVRVRQIADVVSTNSDSRLAESAAVVPVFGSDTGIRCHILGSGQENVGAQYTLKHSHTLAGGHKGGFVVKMPFPDKKWYPYHYQYTLGWIGDFVNASAEFRIFPFVAWNVNASADVGTNIPVKRWHMLPSYYHVDSLCVSDHLVETSGLDAATIESRRDTESENNEIMFGIGWYNGHTSSQVLDEGTLTLSATRYVNETPTHDPSRF